MACSNLLQAMTEDIFVVTSEWDTQISKQLRRIQNAEDQFKARTFSTGIGLRPAEPCSISVAATHHLLTCLLCYLMERTNAKGKEFRRALGATFDDEDLKHLRFNKACGLRALADVVGSDARGEEVRRAGCKEGELRALGRHLAQHVLEVPRSWLLCAAYILVTVTIGRPPVFAIALAIDDAKACEDELPGWVVSPEREVAGRGTDTRPLCRPPARPRKQPPGAASGGSTSASASTLCCTVSVNVFLHGRQGEGLTVYCS